MEESIVFDHTVGSYCDPSYRQGFISYSLEQLSCGRDQDASEVGRIIQFCAAMSTFRNSAAVVVNVYRTSVLAAVVFVNLKLCHFQWKFQLKIVPVFYYAPSVMVTQKEVERR